MEWCFLPAGPEDRLRRIWVKPYERAVCGTTLIIPQTGIEVLYRSF